MRIAKNRPTPMLKDIEIKDIEEMKEAIA